MKIKSSKGMVYNAEWMGGPTGIMREVYCEMRDERPISVIAAEFEGAELTEIERDGAEKTYTGYTELASIGRMDEENLTRISMRKPQKEA
jgi:hypothetical protein